MGTFLGQRLGQRLGQTIGQELCPSDIVAEYRDATFTNASDRHLDYPPGDFRSSKFFIGGTLATRTIGGRLFAQMETSRTNTCPQSENPNGAWWTKFNLTGITPQAIAEPRIFLTSEIMASKMIENSATSVHSAYFTTTPNGSSQYCFSVYAKGDTRTQLVLTLSANGYPANAWCWFNLANGATSEGAGCDSSGTDSCGNGWYRCWFTSTSDAAASGANSVMLHNGVDTTYEGDGTSGLFVWGVQLEIAAVPGNVSSLIQTGHNSFTYSEQFDNAAWTKSGDATINANAVWSPFNTLTADKLTEDATVGDSTYTVSRNYTPDGFSNYTLSVYAKAAGRNHLYMSIATAGFATAPTVYYNLSTGAVGTESGSPVGSDIVDVGGGWYRCAVTALSDAAAASAITIGVATADNDPDYEGDGSSGVYIWGAQIAASLYHGPYLPTTTAARSGAVTRASDQLKWASADVPSALRGKIRFQFIPYWDSTIATGDMQIFDFKASGSSPRIYCFYSAGADRINVVGTGVIAHSQVLTFSRYQMMTITIDPAIAHVNVQGATTGNGDGTAITAWATTEGDVHWGSNNNSSAHCNGLISEPY